MKPFRLIAATIVVGGLATMAWAQTQVLTAQDFTSMAASSDLFEIRSSELALQKSQNAAIKEFAQMMINDHTTASEGLKVAAEKDGFTVPAEMMEKHATQVKALDGADGASFDASYIDAQLAGHQEALTLMTTYAETGDSPALKAHAQKSAPIIQMHLQHVQDLGKRK